MSKVVKIFVCQAKKVRNYEQLLIFKKNGVSSPKNNR
jgi:hypothetical protein